MEWLYYYFIFASSGAFLTWLQLYNPAIQFVRQANPDHIMCKHRCMGSIVWLSTAFVTIPVLTLPLLNNNIRENFIYNLTEGFLRKNNTNIKE